MAPNSFKMSKSMTLSEALVKKLTMDESVQIELEKQRMQKKEKQETKLKNELQFEKNNLVNKVLRDKINQATKEEDCFEKKLGCTQESDISEEQLKSNILNSFDNKNNYFDHETENKSKDTNKVVNFEATSLENLETTANSFDQSSKIQSDNIKECTHEQENIINEKLKHQYSDKEEINLVNLKLNNGNTSETNDSAYKVTNISVNECLIKNNELVYKSEESFSATPDLLYKHDYQKQQGSDVIPQLIVTSEDGMTSSPSFIDDNISWEALEDGVEDRCFDMLSDSSSSESCHDFKSEAVLEDDEYGTEIKITKTDDDCYKKFQMEKIELNLV